MSQNPVSAPVSPILDHLLETHARYASLDDGEVATYIPELAKANPGWFGICLVTCDGHVYEVGDTRERFSIQSISKPFVYGLALEDNSRTNVLEKIGVEPTGDAFNAISLEAGSGRPMNPMINAGAIAAAGMVAGSSIDIRLQRVLDMFSAYAGERLSVIGDVYRSESETGHRNRAIGHMLRNFEILTEPPDPVVDLYFKQCSVGVDCRQLAVMAATLANHGQNPLTGKLALRGEYVESVLSVMASCGMYDYAGEWLYRVGMPAKSGVTGGVIAVLPGQLGIGVFSPRLDPQGNSVRGIKACDDLSRFFDLHLLNNPHSSISVLRLTFSGAEIASSRVRPPAEAQLLRDEGKCVRVYQLQGNLVLSTAEIVVHAVLRDLEETEFVVLDLKHVLAFDECASRLFCDLLVRLRGIGRRLVFAHAERTPQLRRFARFRLKEDFDTQFLTFVDYDRALEWCEDRLVASGGAAVPAAAAPDYELFAGLGAQDLERMNTCLVRRRFAAGECIVEMGDPADELFILASGTASITVPVSGGGEKRLATFSPGTAFGEMAALERAPRSARVTADTEVECDTMRVADFDRLCEHEPRVGNVLLRNLALSLAGRLRAANREISLIDQ